MIKTEIKQPLELNEIDLLSKIGQIQKINLESKAREYKKGLGQYFTDPEIASFMGSIVDFKDYKKDEINFLDSCAGYGILTIAFTIECIKSNSQVKTINVTLYEVDSSIIPELQKVIENLKEVVEETGKEFNYRIINEDFILERPDLSLNEKFDFSVINPPYFKYSVADSKYSKSTKDIFKGDPNIYASFIAVTTELLEENGQAVIISPRSFLNGLYFKGFRNFLLDNVKFDQIHLFKSRSKVFLDSKILQENIIFKITKTKKRTETIKITSSNSSIDLNSFNTEFYNSKIIIDETNLERIIRVPEDKSNYKILEIAAKLNSGFVNDGFFISTGPVVEHRSLEFIRSCSTSLNSKMTPLIKSHNVGLMRVMWDGRHKKDLQIYGDKTKSKFIIPNKRYVILKRFTSKDEPKRIIAGIYEPIPGKDFIGITNKLNYIGVEKEDLDLVTALGLATVLNSSFMDKYYRSISGSTQVNATDVRVLKFPKLEDVQEIGNCIKKRGVFNQDVINEIFERYLENYE